MIGAIFGDIVGSVYEFNNVKTKHFDLVNDKSRFTDDTVMTVAVANALLSFDSTKMEIHELFAEEEGEGDFSEKELAWFKELLVNEMHRMGEAYPTLGYGNRFRFWLTERLTEPYGSYGNGSAMRVSPVAWYANTLEEAISFAKASAEVTHDHPEGIKGALVTAGATYLARTGATIDQIKAFVAKYYKIDFLLDEIRPYYQFDETCQGTVPQAMEAFFESSSFEDAIRNAISIGGDSDTLAAITGAVAEGYYGMSREEEQVVMQKLDSHLLQRVRSFQNRY